MAIRLPDRLDDRGDGRTKPAGEDLTPRQIVAELDKYIVGQDAAKRAVAVAIRNRRRRLRLPEELAQEVAPKNILMIGPTGVGKTEISRRLSRLTGSPFIKVEATKFTEVGYVGRDVESMVRDLVQISINMVHEEQREKVQEKAREQAEERLLDLLLPGSSRQRSGGSGGAGTGGIRGGGPFSMAAEGEAAVEPGEDEGVDAGGEERDRRSEGSDRRATREKLRRQLREGELDDRSVEVEVRESNNPSFQIFSGQGFEQMDVNLQDMLPGLFQGRKVRRRMKVPDALEHLTREAAESLVDEDEVTREALERVETSGIIFLDEIDKVAGRESGRGGPDVSREGVQRDILPIVEGTMVNTRYGMVQTEHVLFLAAGAFHATNPGDLIPELQGRFPIRVELDSLDREDLVRILTEPENALVRQYSALLSTEGVDVRFTDDGVARIAEFAARVNDRTENIGARRLHTIMERVVEDLSFEAPERSGEEVVIDAEYVSDQLSDVVADEDLSKYIL